MSHADVVIMNTLEALVICSAFLGAIGGWRYDNKAGLEHYRNCRESSWFVMLFVMYEHRRDMRSLCKTKHTLKPNLEEIDVVKQRLRIRILSIILETFRSKLKIKCLQIMLNHCSGYTFDQETCNFEYFLISLP